MLLTTTNEHLRMENYDCAPEHARLSCRFSQTLALGKRHAGKTTVADTVSGPIAIIRHENLTSYIFVDQIKYEISAVSRVLSFHYLSFQASGLFILIVELSTSAQNIRAKSSTVLNVPM